ncbi:SMR family transporter [Nocardioides sp. NPDC047086]|uniref:DMT family transporter n=1 Tax=Nocardioides sp. NPDC047086 TaxID=3154810 RepID=UPI0033FB1915
MPWLVLAISGVLEAVWALALARTDGFQRPVPVAVFVVALAASMGGLAYAMQSVPVGTAYAVWVGIGVALTVAYSMVWSTDSISVVRVLLVVGLVGCVIGLKLTH